MEMMEYLLLVGCNKQYGEINLSHDILCIKLKGMIFRAEFLSSTLVGSIQCGTSHPAGEKHFP